VVNISLRWTRIVGAPLDALEMAILNTANNYYVYFALAAGNEAADVVNATPASAGGENCYTSCAPTIIERSAASLMRCGGGGGTWADTHSAT
jgi:hypothetical protein